VRGERKDQDEDGAQVQTHGPQSGFQTGISCRGRTKIPSATCVEF
jgi:hypothetical protein